MASSSYFDNNIHFDESVPQKNIDEGIQDDIYREKEITPSMMSAITSTTTAVCNEKKETYFMFEMKTTMQKQQCCLKSLQFKLTKYRVTLHITLFSNSRRTANHNVRITSMKL